MNGWLDTLEGRSALVIGGGEGLPRRLLGRFERVIAADPDRRLGSPPRQQELREGELVHVSGPDASPSRLPTDLDLIVLAFTLARQDDPVRSIYPWAKRLAHQGRLVLLEWSAVNTRFRPDQKLLADLLTTLEDNNRLKRPGSRDLVRHLQSAGMVHVRQLTELQPAYFTASDRKLLAAEGLRDLQALGLADEAVGRRLREAGELIPGPVTIAHGQFKQLPDPRQESDETTSELEPPPTPNAVEESDSSGRNGHPSPLLLEAEGSLRDLLADVLRDHVPSPEDAAGRLLRSFGTRALTQIRDASLLVREGNLPADVAAHLVRVIRLGRRLFASDLDIEIHGPEDAWRYLAPEMSTLTREHFRGLYLNVKGRIVVDEVISIGTLTSALVHPREVYGPAIEKHCHSVLIAHNHPSGDPSPSVEDINLTRELAEAGRLLNIELLDHIVIGREKYVSLKEQRHF